MSTVPTVPTVNTPAPPRPGLRAALRVALPLLALIVLVLVLFADTLAAMVGIWSRSDTFAHAFLVPPISLWLMWRMRGQLVGLPVRGAPWWLLPIAATCLLWLLGRLAGVAAATQFAVVAMLVLSVPAVLGTAIARKLVFPLLFLFFCVPVGEFLVDPMMEGTADFTVQALRLSGIPVYREGLQFVIPSGNWSVVEACSGVRYLIASFMVGTLFAHLNFRSRKRQLVFVAMSLVVPVVANWVRAYMIVMLGHHSGNTLAVGADHLIYGWVFFGVVILVMFSIGSRFAEHDQPGTVGAATVGQGVAVQATPASSTWGAAMSGAVLLLATQAAMWQLDGPTGAPAPRLSLPALLPGGWAGSDEVVTVWAPQYKNASVVAARTYRQGPASVGVWVAHYRDQGFERKLITSTNVLVPQGSAEWLATSMPAPSLKLEGGAAQPPVRLRASLLRTPADPKVNPRQRLIVWQVYRVGAAYTTSDAQAKFLAAMRRLSGRGDDSAVLMFYAEADEAGRGGDVLQRFVEAHLPRLAALVDAASLPP